MVTCNEIADKIAHLYEGDTSIALASFRELEPLSECENTLYPYLDEFISMLRSEKYIVRVRGFRLLCKQAKWDTENRINGAIEEILLAVFDEKPTAVRLALQNLKYLVPYEKELSSKIRQTVLAINCSAFKDTMQPLIKKDVQALVQLIDES